VAPGHPHHLRLPSVAEERLHRLSEYHLAGRVPEAVHIVEACQIHQRVEHPADADRVVTDRRLESVGCDHERHVHGGLVEQVAVLRFAVIAEPLAVVARDHDGGRAGAGAAHVPLERLHQPADLGIHGGDLAEIRPIAVTASEWLFWRVRRMRIEVVDPQQQRLRRRLGQVSERTIGRFARRALDLPRRLLVVVHVEPPGETKTARKDIRRDERRRTVARLLEPLGDDGMCRGEEPAVFVDAVPAGIQPRHHRRVRRQCLRRRRVRLAEADPPRRDGIEGRGLHPDGLRPDCVGSGGIEGDEEDGGRRP
jgi:hypothetical protein